MFYLPDALQVLHFSRELTRPTHGAEEAVECCEGFGVLLAMALEGATKQQLLDYAGDGVKLASVRGTFGPAARNKRRNDAEGSGYCVRSLEAAIWCFAHTDGFEPAVLEAANLGDDADTTAASRGNLGGRTTPCKASAKAGSGKLHLAPEIDDMAVALLRASSSAA